MKQLLIAGFLLFLSACADKDGDANTTTHKNTRLDSTEHTLDSGSISVKDDTLNTSSYTNHENLEIVFSEMIHKFNSHDTAIINTLVSDALGFHYIYNPGAFIVVSSSSPADLLQTHKWIAKASSEELTFGSKPNYSCDIEAWDKEGVFISEDVESPLLSVHALMEEYDLTNEEASETLKLADKNIQYLVYDTASEMGFYFGLYNDNWYLIAVDIVTHCSA